MRDLIPPAAGLVIKVCQGGKGAGCIAEQLHRLPAGNETMYRGVVARIASRVDPDCEAFFLTTHGAGDQADCPFPKRNSRVIQIMAMWAGIEAGKPTMNGFYGKSPRHWELKDIQVADEREALALERKLDHWIRAKDLQADRVDRVSVAAEWLTSDASTGIE